MTYCHLYEETLDVNWRLCELSVSLIMVRQNNLLLMYRIKMFNLIYVEGQKILGPEHSQYFSLDPLKSLTA